MSGMIRAVLVALILGVTAVAVANASFVTGVDPRAGTFDLGGPPPRTPGYGSSLPSQPQPIINPQAPPPSASPPVVSPPPAVVPDAAKSPAAAHGSRANKHHSRPTPKADRSLQPGASAPAPAPPAGGGATPVQATATAAPSVAGDDSSGPSLGLLIGAIATLGAVAILVLRLQPDWFIRGAAPARDEGGPAAG